MIVLESKWYLLRSGLRHAASACAGATEHPAAAASDPDGLHADGPSSVLSSELSDKRVNQ